MKFTFITRKNLKYLPIIIILLLGFWLRFANLGYSDFQGDEIKALFILDDSQSASEFLLNQRKGPLQFVTTFLLNFVDSTYSNRLLIRLPFATAGFLTILFFFLAVRLHFGLRIATFSSIFIAFNGLFVALTRIVQYQGYVMFFAVLAIYLWTLASKFPNWRLKGLYLGSVSWALSIMSHYDGIFIAPFMLFILWDWYKNSELDIKKALLHIFFAGMLGGLILSVFYVPFILNIADDTKSYWQGRIEGTGGKVSSSIITHKVYNPIYTTPLFIGLFLLGLVFFQKNYKVLIWFLFPFLVMEVLISIPGTHIFNYLIPASIVAGYGLYLIYIIVEKIIKGHFALLISSLGVAVFALFYFLQSHYIFVDNKFEYPWEPEKFLIWEFYPQSPTFHLSLFGFPYYRHWDEIGEFISEYPDSSGHYSTNERDSIARHHIKLRKDTNSAGFYVFIHNPQSYTKYATQEKAEYWRTTYEPVKVFYKNGKPISEIYYMEVGSFDKIKELGF